MQKLITVLNLLASAKLAFGILVLLTWLQSGAYDYTTETKTGMLISDSARMLLMLIFFSFMRYYLCLVSMRALNGSSKSLAMNLSDENDGKAIVFERVTVLALKAAVLMDIFSLILESLWPSMFINAVFLLTLTPTFYKFLSELYKSMQRKWVS